MRSIDLRTADLDDPLWKTKGLSNNKLKILRAKQRRLRAKDEKRSRKTSTSVDTDKTPETSVLPKVKAKRGTEGAGDRARAGKTSKTSVLPNVKAKRGTDGAGGQADAGKTSKAPVPTRKGEKGNAEEAGKARWKEMKARRAQSYADAASNRLLVQVTLRGEAALDTPLTLEDLDAFLQAANEEIVKLAEAGKELVQVSDFGLKDGRIRVIAGNQHSKETLIAMTDRILAGKYKAWDELLPLYHRRSVWVPKALGTAKQFVRDLVRTYATRGLQTKDVRLWHERPKADRGVTALLGLTNAALDILGTVAHVGMGRYVLWTEDHRKESEEQGRDAEVLAPRAGEVAGPSIQPASTSGGGASTDVPMEDAPALAREVVLMSSDDEL